MKMTKKEKWERVKYVGTPIIIFGLMVWIIIWLDANRATDASPIQPDFRNSTWGMTMKQVIETEGEANNKSEKDGLLFYYVQYNNKNSMVIFEFENNKLFAGSYLLDTDTATCIQSFYEVRASILHKDSSGVMECVKWKNAEDSVKFSTLEKTGLLAGRLEYKYSFTQGNTLVVHWLRLDTNLARPKITHNLYYRNKIL
jgi:hypothetical protein